MTKREPVNPSRHVRTSKRSIPKQSAINPDRPKANIGAARREPAHPSAPRNSK
jgi:hypothetical protein